MAKRRLKKEDIAVGKPLFIDVFDDDGNLLLKEGSIIESGAQMQVLYDRGLYYYESRENEVEELPPLKVRTYPFEVIDEIYTGLNLMLGHSAVDPKLPSKIIKLCQMLQDACDNDPNACLGMLSFGHYYKYPIIHSIHTALVCRTILKRIGWPAEKRLLPMAAAMTMNISMIELQQKLYSQRAPLTEAQRADIKNHPERSVDLLEKCGVNDDVWLETIMQHHELLDGTGYPRSLKGADILEPSRIVTIGDVYGAKVSNRSYRRPILPTDALRELFQSDGQHIDLALSKILIKNLGLFPPGTFVELQNGEIAVVIRVGNDVRYPVVCSVVGVNGKVLARPAIRDCTIKGYAIKKVLTKNEARIEVNRYQLWGYM
jgi:HD-GYP domain-containing protein (c-di-GMP phosphodiesterase class II)